jgi:hypothetical protein
MHLGRALTAAVAALVASSDLSFGAPPPNGAKPTAVGVTCTNLVSGASWQVTIDLARSTVDSVPARVSSSEISWHDQVNGGNYTLDRKSGELTAVFASSTGGYFIHGRCSPES